MSHCPCARLARNVAAFAPVCSPATERYCDLTREASAEVGSRRYPLTAPRNGNFTPETKTTYTRRTAAAGARARPEKVGHGEADDRTGPAAYQPLERAHEAVPGRAAEPAGARPAHRAQRGYGQQRHGRADLRRAGRRGRAGRVRGWPPASAAEGGPAVRVRGGRRRGGDPGQARAAR